MSVRNIRNHPLAAPSARARIPRKDRLEPGQLTGILEHLEAAARDLAVACSPW